MTVNGLLLLLCSCELDIDLAIITMAGIFWPILSPNLIGLDSQIENSIDFEIEKVYMIHNLKTVFHE